MSRIKRTELERVGRELVSFGSFLIANAETIAVRANCDSDEGVSGVSYGGSRSGSGHSDPVGVKAVPKTFRVQDPVTGEVRERDRWDPVHNAEDRFVSLLRDMELNAAQGKRRAQSFLSISEKEAKALLKGGEIASRDGEADRYGYICANPACKRDVAGTQLDRLRSGRCEPCFRWRLNHHGNERPREVCHPEDEAEAV